MTPTVITADAGFAPPDHFPKPSDFTWMDQLNNLLHLGAVLEHRLMVQYLYAAYSLGGEQVPEEHRPIVKEWRDSLLAVAREEMGHLLTVQNVLTFLGAGFNLDPDHFPWRFASFALEPFSLGSLACYVSAEMPIECCKDFGADDRDQVLADAKAHLPESKIPLVPVAELYSRVLELLADEGKIPEVALHPGSYCFQASWDEWGRGYAPEPRLLDSEGNLVPVTEAADRAAQFESHILIDRVATRTQALDAIRRLSEQGEGPNTTHNAGEWTHFRRFHKIYQEYRQIAPEKNNWRPARALPTNPNTNSADIYPDGYISHPRTRRWADLFNIRYRMLLTFLMHTYQIGAAGKGDAPNVRAMVMHRVFGEMYHVKTLAGRVVRMPQREGNDGRFAGPPFQLPRNLRIPMADDDCWSVHLMLLEKSRSICSEILADSATPEDAVYIHALLDIDEKTEKWICAILAGMNSHVRYTAR